MLRKAQTKKLLPSSCQNLWFKETAALNLLNRSGYLQKRTEFFSRLRDFLKVFNKASKSLQISLPKSKFDIGCTKSKKHLFVHYYNDIIEHPNRRFLLWFRFRNNNPWVFSFKKFELHGNHFILKEIVNVNNREIHHPFKNRFYLAIEYGIIERNYKV